jgi:hypothetical protein
MFPKIPRKHIITLDHITQGFGGMRDGFKIEAGYGIKVLLVKLENKHCFKENNDC